MLPLEGRVVWVTGSAKRVGKAVALHLARCGADIAVHCNRSRDDAEAVATEIRALGRRALVVQGDHARREDVARMVGEIAEEFDALFALVNSAAIYPEKAFDKTTDADFDEAINANLRGPFLCTQLALPLLRRSSPAHVVFLGDARVWRPYKGYAAYWCAKGGLETLAKGLASELAPGILVNTVHPGAMIPPPDNTDEKNKAVVARNFIKRWGKPEDIALAVEFLLRSDYITGAEIPVDGGRNLG